MTVIVKHDYLTGDKAEKDWWMGQVTHCNGDARAPKIHNLVQIADADSGVIRWVNADPVCHICWTHECCSSMLSLLENK